MNFWRTLNAKVEEIFQNLENDIVNNGTLAKRAGTARKVKIRPASSRANKKNYRKIAGDKPHLREGAMRHAIIEDDVADEAEANERDNTQNNKMWQFHNLVVEYCEAAAKGEMKGKAKEAKIAKIRSAFERLDEQSKTFIEPIVRARATGWGMLPVNAIFEEEG